MAKQKLKTTDKQAAANRRNAGKSTGPITPAGKANASRNSLKHGLLASDIIVGVESSEEFERFRDAMAERLAPDGELETMLAQRIIAAAWRLRRTGRIEQEMLMAMAGAAHDHRAELERINLVLGTEKPRPVTLGSMLTGHAVNWGSLNNLARYEGHLERIVYKGLHELQRLQAVRNNHPVALPAALDISVTGVEPD